MVEAVLCGICEDYAAIRDVGSVRIQLALLYVRRIESLTPVARR